MRFIVFYLAIPFASFKVKINALIPWLTPAQTMAYMN